MKTTNTHVSVLLDQTIGTRFVDPPPLFFFYFLIHHFCGMQGRGSRVFVFLEMGLYRSRIEFLVMFEVVQHCYI